MDIRAPNITTQKFFWNLRVDISAATTRSQSFWMLGEMLAFLAFSSIFGHFWAFSSVEECLAEYARYTRHVEEVAELIWMFWSIFKHFRALWAIFILLKKDRGPGCVTSRDVFEKSKWTFQLVVSRHDVFWSYKSGHLRPQRHVICPLISCTAVVTKMVKHRLQSC